MSSILRMDAEDINLKLLVGNSFYVDNYGDVPALTVKDITNKGYDGYLELLNVIVMNPSDVIDDKEAIDRHDLKTSFDIFLLISSDDFRHRFQEALSFFLKEHEFRFDDDLIIVGEYQEDFLNNKIITRENFREIVEIIKYQSGMNLINNDNKEPSNKKAQEIAEKMKKAKAIIKNKKKDDSEVLLFSNIISSVTVKSNSINKFNVSNLTMFQLYDEYKRLEHISAYDIGLKSLMNGAKEKDVNLKHWSGSYKEE